MEMCCQTPSAAWKPACAGKGGGQYPVGWLRRLTALMRLRDENKEPASMRRGRIQQHEADGGDAVQASGRKYSTLLTDAIPLSEKCGSWTIAPLL